MLMGDFSLARCSQFTARSAGIYASSSAPWKILEGEVMVANAGVRCKLLTQFRLGEKYPQGINPLIIF